MVKKMLNSDLLKDSKKINFIILNSFLFIIVATIILRLTTSALLDLGYNDGNIHIGYKNHVQDFGWAYEDGLRPNQPNASGILAARVLRSPNFFWLWTQFTWLTTLVIFLVIFFRVFRNEGANLKFLKWIMTQKTLSLVTMYEIVVGVGFWIAMFQDFQGNFSPDPVLNVLELTTTILVHAIIPVFTVVYSIFYLILDQKAARLRARYLLIGMIFPILYAAYYYFIALIWNDPYPLTNIATGEGWWKIFIGLTMFYISLGIMLVTHNYILLKFNKKYIPNQDSETWDRIKNIVEKNEKKAN